LKLSDQTLYGMDKEYVGVWNAETQEIEEEEVEFSDEE